MTTHTFTLIVEGPDVTDPDIADALFEAGCDDALVGRSHGVQFVDFDREAESIEDAVLSAVTAVESVEGLRAVRLADAGLVSMSEIAKRVGQSREYIRLLVEGRRGPGGFPAPATDPRVRYRLWRTDDVERWMTRHFGADYGTAEDDARDAINSGLEFRCRLVRVPMRTKSALRSLVEI